MTTSPTSVNSTAPTDCALCPRLCESRKAVVNGFGPIPARVMVVAQNPGRQEELKSRPLVGWSGDKLRNHLMPLAGIDPDSVRYENIVRCRPPRKADRSGDAPPTAAEVRACRGFLEAAIALCHPEIIITLGDPALRWFFPNLKLSAVHGRAQEWGTSGPPIVHIADGEFVGNPTNVAAAQPPPIKVVPMYHPAAATPNRRPELMEVMENDWRVLPGSASIASRASHLGDYQLIGGDGLADLLRAAAPRAIAFDLETDAESNKWRGHFQPWRAKIIGYSVAWEEGRAYYVEADNLEAIRPWLEDPALPKLCHNAKYEWHVCTAYGVRLANLHDTKLMAYVLRKPSTHLKALTWNELGIEQTRWEDVDWEDINSVAPYGAADSDFTLRIAHKLGAELKAQRLWRVYEIERGALVPLAHLECNGVRGNPRPLAELKQRLQIRLEVLDCKLRQLYPYPVNWRSPQQKAEALYGPSVWRCVPGRTLKTRSRVEFKPPGLNLPDQGTTDIDALRRLDHPVARLLVERSAVVTCISKDLTALPNLIAEDGRVHTTYHQAGGWEEGGGEEKAAPETGRTSSSGPNLQNITGHGDAKRPYIRMWAHVIRAAFFAPTLTICRRCGIIDTIQSGGDACGKAVQGSARTVPLQTVWERVPPQEDYCGGQATVSSVQGRAAVYNGQRVERDSTDAERGGLPICELLGSGRGWCEPTAATVNSSFGDGGGVGTEVGSLGVGASPQWGKDRQSYRKPGGGDSRPPLRGCDVPTLRQGISSALTPHDWVVERWVLVRADIGQEEPRIVALLSGDAQLLADLTPPNDVYRPIAALAHSVTNVTSEQRQTGKRIFLEWAYGGRSFTKSAPWLTAEQRGAIIKYIETRYPAVALWQRKVLRQLRLRGFVESWFGRRRYFPGYDEAKAGERAEMERAAINAPIQMTAADILKLAMARVDGQLPPLGAVCVLQVHDELVVEAMEYNHQTVVEVLKHMCDGLLPITLPVEVSVGPDWSNQKRV